MSQPVPLEGLRAATDERGAWAYVLTVSDESRSHAVHGAVRWEGDVLLVAVGARSAANAAARPLVSLLYPARSEGDYTLIVDGTAAVADGELRITPTKAILHRHRGPGSEVGTSGACASDCVPIATPADERAARRGGLDRSGKLG